MLDRRGVKDISNKAYMSESISSVINKIENESKNLLEVAEISLGITPYDKYRGHNEDTIKNRKGIYDAVSF